ncbi:hypothetical protein OXPF_37350 [Oxobacter pfennigii]|uniref:Uncharacterized protein n=1 Tax=Oxobacter pfennigii TaxID=36849 RepID=A0A0P8WXB3_9CLOT|nr:hypothetical protein [Oxobacter pfennigii]KPU42966.1 hypothetical protein OXPF_37350 [Oxobacter pfennigii]
MRIIFDEYGDSLHQLNIRDIKTYDYKSMENLKEIIKILSNGDKFYFQFAREDYFLEDNELLEYRNQVPQYLKQNGFYEVKYRLDETRFDSIGYLPTNEGTYNQILILWQYFETLVFFNPSSILSWKEFGNKFDWKKPLISPFEFIEKKYTNSIFIKGHDGDNLIFIYGRDFDESLIKDVIRFIGN